MKAVSLVIAVLGAALALAPSALAAAPANDAFANAETLPYEVPLDSTNVEATDQKGEGETSHGGVGPSASVWFTYTAPATERTILYANATGFRPVLTVYTGSSLGGLTKVVDSSEFIPFGEEEGYVEVAFDGSAGQKYKVAVDTGNALETGPFTIGSFSFVVEPNDAFATPTILSGDTAQTNGNTGLATMEANEPAHSGYGPYGSLWFSWTAGSNGPTKIDTAGSNSDTRLGVYTGSSLTSLVPVAESDDVSATDRTSAVAFEAAAGTTYRIVVDNGNHTPEPYGPFQLKLAHTPVAAPQAGGGVSIDTAIKAPKSAKLKGKAKKAKVTLKLSSPTAGATFECSVDHGAFKPCPATFAVSLKKGKHTIQVRAKAADGSVDASPATATVKVKPAPKPKHKKKH